MSLLITNRNIILLIFSTIHFLSIYSGIRFAPLTGLTSVFKYLIKQLFGRIPHFKINI